MNIKETIRAEIERQLKAIANSPSDGGEMDAINGARCLELMSFRKYIDTLPERPVEGLDSEIDACWQNWLSPSNQKEVDGVLPKTEFAMYARHFAEWGAEHLKR